MIKAMRPSDEVRKISSKHMQESTLKGRPISGDELRWWAWSVVAAFGTYFCMYFYRKPFTAASFSGDEYWGIHGKTLLVSAQVLGYMVSKFVGIKVIAEMKPDRRALGILVLIGIAELALLLFALTPAPYNAIWLFVNGLPLGMVFGLVLGFLEGRRQTEALTAGLCASFIVADGVAKSVGASLLEFGVSESWMPSIAGLLFLPPLVFFVWMLTRVPQPSSSDVAERTERVPMNGAERWRFFTRYAAGLTFLLLAYLLITILRSIRADFAPEIWHGLGTTEQPGVYSQSEMLVAFGVMVLNAGAVFVRDNRRAFYFALALSISGLMLIGIALIGLQAGSLSGFGFMVLLGLGLYLPYVAVHTTIFERLIAMTRDRGNLGYLMYLADAFGYLGYVGVMFAKNIWGVKEQFLDFFITLSWGIAAGAAVLLLLCGLYFALRSVESPRST